MNETLKFIIEVLVSFIVISLIYYFILKRQARKKNEKKVPAEVNIILRFHKIDLTKINYNKMMLMISMASSFGISIVFTVMVHFVNSSILIIIVSGIIALPIALMFYDMIGRYFEKKSKEVKEEEKEKEKENNNKKKG